MATFYGGDYGYYTKSASERYDAMMVWILSISYLFNFLGMKFNVLHCLKVVNKQHICKI